MENIDHSTQVLLYSRDYYQLSYHEDVAHGKSCYIQSVNTDSEFVAASKTPDQIFHKLPENIQVITCDDHPRHVSRMVCITTGQPLFTTLASCKTVTDAKEIIFATLAYLKELENKGAYNTGLTPYTLIYTRETGSVQYLNLDCNLLKGRIESPLYRAPELIGKLKAIYSLHADFYSLGIILYEHFLGKHPFEGLSTKRTRREQIVRNLKPLHKVVADFPRPLSLIINKLLAKQPSNRYQTCYAINKDFEDYFNGEIENEALFVPGMFDFQKCRNIAIPESFTKEKSKILDHLLFETEERNHKVIFITGSQLNATDLFIRNYLSHHGKNNTLIASAHVKENAKYLPFYTAALVFKEMASWLLHSKIYKDQRFIDFSEQTDSIIIETLVHICPELEILKSKNFRPVDQPISDTNILYTAVKHLFRFLGSITKPLIISLNNTEYIDKDSTKLFFEVLSTADIPHLAFVFQTFSQTKRPKLFNNRNAKFTALEMWHLDNEHITELLDNLTNGKLSEKQELIQLLREKCLGKFELVKQFLVEMQQNGSLFYNQKTGMWHWDKSGTVNIESPLSLEEICLKKQQFMSQPAIELLKQAALIGNVFNLNLLSTLTGQTKEQLFIKLEEATALNLVFELTQYSNFKTPENSIFFKFASDRAFRLYFKQGKHSYGDRQILAFEQTIHYLLKRGNNKLLFEDFFASIPKFSENLSDDNRAEIVQVMIGKIKDYIFLCKFNKAEKLIQLCFDLLPDHAWLNKYYLTKELYYTAIVLSYNTDTFEATDSLYADAHNYLVTPEDHIKFNLVYADSRLKRNDTERAKQILTESARLVDPTILEPAGLKERFLQKAIGLLFRNRVRNNELKYISSQKSNIKDSRLAQINTLAHKLDKSIYYASLAIILRKVFLHGLYDDFTLSLLIYSKRLLDARRHISFALKLADFAINNVSEKYIHIDQCKLYYYTNIHPFSERIQSSKQKIKNAIDQRVSLGDLTTAYDLSFDYIFRSLAEGEKLQNLLNETQKIWRIKRKYSKRQLDFDLLTVFHDRIKALYDHQRVSDVTRDSEKFERHAKLSFWNNLTLLIYFYNTDHFDKALICAGNAQLRSDTIENNLPIIMLEFYYCLSLAEDFPNMSHYRKLEALRYIKVRHNELAKLSRHSKENFHHMELLLQGTIYRLSKRSTRAIPTIKQAAYVAEKYGNINIQAMCYKILAQVALDQHKDVERRQYLIKAYNYYKKWGANTIAERIKLDNFQVFEEMNLRIFNVI